MKRLCYSTLLAFAAVLFAGLAFAADGRDCTSPVHTPAPNGAVIATRVFNDCPGSDVSFFDNYPSQVWIRDTGDGCVGWANLHVWSFSEDGGLTPAVFENCSHYKYWATVTINGSGAQAEAGLRLSPWWSLDVDGRFMVRANGNGEIACFGGRLPFYSFTVSHGVTYTAGNPIYMEIDYDPHTLSQADPATIQYTISYLGNVYTSGLLPFDQGNPNEDPPHGQWGELYPTRVGGYFQLPNGNGGAAYDITTTWSDIGYLGEQATPTTSTTWGKLKTLYR